MPNQQPNSVVVVGAGNIGSHLLGIIARDPSIHRVTIVDRDNYEAKNLASQDISHSSIGHAKALVQARRLRRINPRLAVETFAEPVENVPLGRLRADALLACVDSRQARRHLNQVAYRLAMPMVDAGVLADGLLARVDVYTPHGDAACLECGWTAADYQALEQAYPCQGEDVAAPTDAPASLGALAAALQAIECEKLLSGRPKESTGGRQIVLAAGTQRHFVTALRRNDACRFDHRSLRIEALDASPARLSLGRVLTLAPVVRGVHGELTLAVEGKSFLSEVRCPACGDARPTSLRLSGRLHPSVAMCGRCARSRVASAFDAVERLTALLPKSVLSRPLSSFGFRRGDVFTLATNEAEAHFEIGPR